jgi:hypothetical protein
VEGKLIYLIFLALYFFLQYKAAQKKKQQQQQRKVSAEKPVRGRGNRTLDDILKEAQKQIQAAQKMKEEKKVVPTDVTQDRTFSSSSYKSIVDKHNKNKSVYTPLTNNESYSGLEGESVFTEQEIAASHINEPSEIVKTKSFEFDLRQAIIAETVLNRPYA